MTGIRLPCRFEFGDFTVEVDFVGAEFAKQVTCGKWLEPVCLDEFIQVIPSVPTAYHLAVLFSGVFVGHGGGLDV